MKNFVNSIRLWYYDQTKEKALKAFSEAIEDYLTMIVVFGDACFSEELTTPYGTIFVRNEHLVWENGRYEDDGMTPVRFVETSWKQPYGYIRFDFTHTNYSSGFITYMKNYLAEQGYNVGNQFIRSYTISIFVSTDKVYGEKPYPFLIKE